MTALHRNADIGSMGGFDDDATKPAAAAALATAAATCTATSTADLQMDEDWSGTFCMDDEEEGDDDE